MRKKSMIECIQPADGIGKSDIRKPSIFSALLIGGIFVFLVSACAPKAANVRPDEQSPAAVSTINRVEVGEADGRSVLTIQATAPLQGKYTVMKISDPPRLIIEMPSVESGTFAGPIEVKDGTIGRIDVSKMDGAGIRFEVELTSLVEHEVKADDKTLEVNFVKAPEVVEVATAKEEAKPVEMAVAEAPKEAVQEEAKPVEVVAEPKVPAVEEKAPVSAPVEQPKMEEKQAVDKAEKAEKTLRVTDVKVKKFGRFTTAEIITDGEPSKYNVFDLKTPARVVVDIENAREIASKREIKADSSHVKGARVGRYDGQVRVVFDHKGEVKPYDVVKGKDRIIIFFGRKPTVAKKEAEPKVKKAKVGAKKVPKKIAKIEPKMVEEKAAGPETQPVEEATKVEHKEESAQVEARADEAKEVVQVSAPAPEAKPEVKAEEMKKATAEQAAETVQGKPALELKPTVAKEGAGKAYTGQKVTLEFKDADIKNIFRVIAEVSGYNMIIDNAVSGKVTLRLVNVPWDQALDLILETNSLGMTKVGNVIRVLPIAMIRKTEEDKMASQKAKEKLEELVTKLIPVSYAKSGDMVAKIKGVMTDRGTAIVDERTNTIILKDIQKSVDEAAKLVASLDEPTPQVVIEARIVEANTNFTRDLGVQWGAGHTADAAHGNPTGYYFPNSYNVTAGGGGSFSLNPPAAGGVGPTGGAVGISFGSINNTLNLDLRLSALETQGWGKIISSPKIITLDNKEASIQQGVSIPFETTSSSGTQTTFVDANLNLTVTPHVTADGRLSMKIKATKNAPSLAFRGASGAPSIDKKEATTEILVKDGDTTVIGGIYQITKAESETGTPFLKSLPFIGWLFKSKSVQDQKTELLIFITPRIVREKPV